MLYFLAMFSSITIVYRIKKTLKIFSKDYLKHLIRILVIFFKRIIHGHYNIFFIKNLFKNISINYY